MAALYGETIDVEDIAGSFAEFIERADPLIAAGQTTAAALAEAYLQTRAARAGIELALDEVADIAGTTRSGDDLATGMAAFAPMVLARIGRGRPLDEAIAFGRYLATRFADAEVTGAVDRVLEDPAVRSRLVGWTGTVSAGACDGCKANAGDHDVDWAPYRHPNCNCVVEPRFG